MNDAPYKPRHFGPMKLLALILRGLASLLSTWPLVLIAALAFSPIGPHVLTTYQYYDLNGHKNYLTCNYLGVRGFVTRPAYGGECPFLTIIDHRNG